MAILGYEHLGELAHLEDAISTVRKGIQLIDDGRPAKLVNLGHIHRRRFGRLGNAADLVDALSAFKAITNSKPCPCG
jgi:hypothetical protein